MQQLRRFGLVICLVPVLVLAAFATAPASAAVITFRATDIADISAGEDLWTYEYFVSGVVFDRDQGFSIYFDPALYANLENPARQVNPTWDILTLQPDAALPADGIYDALALSDGASLGQPFTLTFAWLGTLGTPGSQTFTINEFDQAGNLSVLESGATTLDVGTAPVPEPPTLLLLASGIGVVVRRRLVAKLPRRAMNASSRVVTP